VDVVAHSFGAFLVAEAMAQLLRRDPDSAIFHTVILAAGAYSLDYEAERVVPIVARRLVNECSWHDIPLCLSQMFGPGMAGKLGVCGIEDDRALENRFFLYGHSDFFVVNDRNEGHMSTYWLPLLLADEPIVPVDQRLPLPAWGPLWLSVLRNLQIAKLIAFAVVIWAGAIAATSIRDGRTQRAIATSLSMAAEANDALWLEPWKARRLALQALEQSRTPGAEAARRRAEQQSRAVVVVKEPGGAPLLGATSAGKNQLITINAWDSARLWTLTDCREMTLPNRAGMRLSAYQKGTNLWVPTQIESSRGLQIRLWDWKPRPIVVGDTSPNPTHAPSTEASISPSGRYLAVSASDYRVRVFDTANLNVAALKLSPLEDQSPDIINAVRFVDEDTIVTAGQNGRAKVWAWRTGRVTILRRKTAALFDVRSNPVLPSIIYAAGQMGSVMVWSVVDGGHLLQEVYPSSGYAIHGIDVSPNGRQLVAASVNGTAVVYDLSADGRVSVETTTPVVLRGHTGAVMSAEFIDDGRGVLTSSVDGTARVWTLDGPQWAPNILCGG
jgi:WD40 repeat protein